MSNPIVTVQVRSPVAAPRGAEFLGSMAALICTLVGGLAQAVAGTPAARPESRHA